MASITTEIIQPSIEKRSLTPTVEHQQLHKECDKWYMILLVRGESNCIFANTYSLVVLHIAREQPEVLTYEKEVKFHNPQEIMQVIAEYVSWRA